ncbi:hypothetical protein GO986_02675 [Deinococcus sp. HMF7620]|uniref:Uncharacterized protein n=1 Tax=Deinococcus arboris TaxID=2682977 RepID=A0A7C9M6H8_9DEIO|nr:hypothetical protein [Deinococcus arboris]MVN85663.1 hypothetical protein [Deinococcus arboris]
MTPLSNKRKVRGGQTQLRRVDQWRQQNLTPDWSHLAHNGVDYVKLWIDPWSRLPAREPPAWLRRRMLSGLLDIHDAWTRASAGRPDVAYLALWLCWPHFASSQVVMASPERAEMYRTMFTPAPARPLPAQLSGQEPRLLGLNWRTGLDEDVLEGEEVARRLSLLRRPYRVETPSSGEPLYFFPRGHVWVGQQLEAR